MRIFHVISRSFGTLGILAALPMILTAAGQTRADRAVELLERHGSVFIASAGPYVERGTFRVQVEAKLGLPDRVLPDGTWLYHHRRIDDSAATGTLVVRFVHGRVSSLALVTPAVVAALKAAPLAPEANPLLATK